MIRKTISSSAVANYIIGKKTAAVAGKAPISTVLAPTPRNAVSTGIPTNRCLSMALKEIDHDHDQHEDTISSSSSGSNPDSTRTSNIKVPTTRRRPRLDALRNQLKNQTIQDDKQILSKSKKSNTKSTSSADAHTDTQEDPSKPSWQKVLQLAKEHYQHIDNEQHHQQHHQIQQINQPSQILTDSYSRQHSYLRISLVERCNLRCKYCMPPEGVPLQKEDKLLGLDEIDRLVTLFQSNGVDKVRLTGGEPLLRKDINQIISSISNQPNIKSVGITTNAITLSRNLPSLVDAGLTHANISLDTLDATRFQNVTRRKGLHTVLKAIEDAVELLPEGNVKVNCVVMKGFNDDELRDFIMLTKDMKVDMRFIEWMPFSENGWSQNRFLSYEDMMHYIRGTTTEDHGSDGSSVEYSSLQGVPPIQLSRINDGPNDTTKWWKAPNHKGRVGFITSMSQHFCGTCNRLRITADGQLKVCLFGSTEVSLRDAMRGGVTDEELGLIVRAALGKKKFALGGHGSAEGIRVANDNRPMTLIGG
jgi:molybdenum cofactor biosynthesis protein A